MELHGKCPNPPWKYQWRNFHGSWGPNPPWNPMENVLILHGEISMEYHGN